MSEEQEPPSGTFTLRDLFVSVAIVALLMSLVLVFLNAQEQDRLNRARGGCRNNMKQLALGLQNHNDAFKTFPPLYFSNNPVFQAAPPLHPAEASDCYSWQLRLLPFIEEDKLYKNISRVSVKFTSTATNALIISPANRQVSPGSLRLSQFICPASSGEPDGVCNYVAMSATRLPLLTETESKPLYSQKIPGLPKYDTRFKIPPDGLIVPDFHMQGQSIARMADGTSKTAVLIESREEARSNWYDPRQSFVVGFLPADSTPIDTGASDYYPSFGPPQPGPPNAPAPARWQFNPTAGNRTALNYGPQHSMSKEAYHGVAGDPLERTWGPSSEHHGGIIIVGMGDGSVREIKADIDPAVFFSAITARGGEAVPTLPE